jgi:hypothetical protein
VGTEQLCAPEAQGDESHLGEELVDVVASAPERLVAHELDLQGAGLDQELDQRLDRQAYRRHVLLVGER